MNWLKTFWNWFTTPKAGACCAEPYEVTLVEVEESLSVGEVFLAICRTAGVKQRDLKESDAAALFEEWYTGTCDEESICASIAEFKLTQPGVAAKLNGKL
jgi:hypothetical protein